MYLTFQKGTRHFVEIKDANMPSGIVNTIPITIPRKPAENFPFFAEGTDWIEFDLLVAVTGGMYRYATSGNLTGHFVTNILCSSAIEARKRLKLPEGNSADTKAKVRIEPTTVVIGHMPGTQDVQMCIMDSGKLVFINSGLTAGSAE